MKTVVEKFLDTVQSLAEQNDLDVLVIANGKTKIIGNPEYITFGKRGKTNLSVMYQDLYDYINKMKTDDGVIKVVPELIDRRSIGLNEANPQKYRLQVYDTKMQVNICIDPDGSGLLTSLGNIVFHENDFVDLIRVNNAGYADYDHPYTLFKWHPINKATLSHVFGMNGNIAADILVTLLRKWKFED